jgi:hypothetical protein
MTNAVLDRLTKHEREKVLAEEARRRRLGEWGAWTFIEFPKGSVGSGGWTHDFQRAAKNRVFAVLIREVATDMGLIVHLAVSSLSGIRPTFHEMQRVKNELAGEESTAIEIYPPASELVDGADQFHIWCVPRLPFGLFDRKST